ncbi:MAG: alpha/beta hydrolase [Methanomassiliicoccus sp.]|nr:alpha/beta hydrolase [Methanomassiliicoccus sp.]
MANGTGYIEVEPGVEIHVQDWGEGRPIVFIHGWPLNLRMFDAQSLELPARGIRVIALDLRGFGLSTKTWEGLDYDVWASDVGRVISILGLNNVTLAGFSMGGAIAAHYVATSKDPRVSKLALLAAAVPRLQASQDFPEGVPAEAITTILDGEHADIAKGKSDFGKNFFSTDASPELHRWYDQMGLEAPPRSTIRGFEELRDRDLRQEMGHIDLPTRIFHGVNDHIVPFALAQAQNRLIKGSKLVKFDVGGHAFCYEERDRLNDELEKFVMEGEPGVRDRTMMRTLV